MNHVIIEGNITSKSPPLSGGVIPLIVVTFSGLRNFEFNYLINIVIYDIFN
jgi:hypothetical protein